MKDDFTANWMGKTTLANLGESTSYCVSHKLVHDTLLLGCQSGAIKQFTSVGAYALNTDAFYNNICTSSSPFSTGLNCRISNKESTLFQKLNQDCIGKKDCIIRDVDNYLPLNQQGECKLDKSSTLFVQFKCIVPDGEIFMKRQ